MQRKGFPHISSMPTMKVHQDKRRQEHIPLRSIETSDLCDLPSITSPYKSTPSVNVPSVDETSRFIPISIGSLGENDGKNGRLDEELRDFQLPVVLKKQSSMLNLRNRRDQAFQGVRTLRVPRIINKAGNRNISTINLPEKSARYLKDLVTTLLDAQWRWVLMIFAFGFFGTWTIFALLWMIIAWSHGDLEFDEETGQRLGDGAEECIRGATNFAGFFLLSVESQVSTGYGERYPTEECPEAIFLLIVQLTIGVIIDGAMIGIVFVKVTRPPKYADFKFSKKAVVCQRDSKLCLFFRVADFKEAHSIDTKIRAYLFRDRLTSEGERTGKSQQRLKLENNGRVFLIFPNLICHTIDKDSPFYDMSAKDLLEQHFEIVVSMTGISKHTAQMTQARTSYLAREIMWGHRFMNVVSYDNETEQYVTHVDALDSMEQIDTALCSAKRLDEIVDEYQEVIEREALNECISNIDVYDENDDGDVSGLHMVKKPLPEVKNIRKFNVTKVPE